MSPADDPSAADDARNADLGERPTASTPGVVGAPTPVRIAGYRIIALLGSGGMGLVYEAEQEALRRRVALKVMKPGLVRPDLLARFESEGRMLARLRHEGIAGVIDAGVHRDEHGLSVPYLVLELVESSVTLERYLRDRRVTTDDAVSLMILISDAVAAAHEVGIVHRDLKPSNILVTPAWSGGRVGVRLIDFGIAKVLGESLGTDAPVTATGVVIGTPEYMAPEQILGRAIDHRVDVFALGAILFEMLTGSPPHQLPDRADRESLRAVVCERDAPSVRSRRPEVPVDLDVIASKCLRREPADRYESVSALAADLRAFAAGRPIAARPETLADRAAREVRLWTGRRPKRTVLVVAAVATLTGSFVFTPIVFDYSNASIAYAARLARFVPASVLPSDLPDTRIVAITDETDVERVAAEAGIAGVTNGARASWRRVYAELVRRLVAAGVRGIGIDLLFRRDSEHDQPLVEALDAARRSGVPVVLASPSWSSGDDGAPAITSGLASEASLGPVTGGFTGPDTWALDLAMMRPGSEPTPSLALQLAARARVPHATLSLAEAGLLEVRFLRDGPRRTPLREPVYVRTSGVQLIDTDDAELGLRAGDRVLQLLVPLDRARLADATTALERAMSMTPDALRERFAGQLVLIGNTSVAGGDLREPPGAAPMPGVWSHAAGVQRLLRDDALMVPRTTVMHGLIGVLALLGAVAGLMQRRWVVAALVLTAAPLLGSVLWFRGVGVLWNPLAAMGTALLALAIGAWLASLGSHPRTGAASRGGERLT